MYKLTYLTEYYVQNDEEIQASATLIKAHDDDGLQFDTFLCCYLQQRGAISYQVNKNEKCNDYYRADN